MDEYVLVSRKFEKWCGKEQTELVQYRRKERCRKEESVENKMANKMAIVFNQTAVYSISINLDDIFLSTSEILTISIRCG
jgi:hypothetical protein